MANALIGEPKDFVTRKTSLPSLTNLAPGLPVELLRDSAMAMARDAESISEMELSGFILESCVLAQEPDLNTSHQLLLPTLMERCKLASRLVSDYLASIEGGR
jgi:hypothetical protein